MTVRSVIDIDLNDAKFVAFKKLHDQYMASLAKAPAQWALVNAAMAKAEGTGRRQLTVFQQITAATRTMSTALESVARSLLRISTVTGVIGGLVGIGSLFGIERLAGNAAAARRSALGLGTGYGGLQAFGGAFGRFVGGDFLERVAGGRFDISQRIGLMGAGLTSGQIDSGDTATTGVALLRALKRIADTTDPRLFASVIQNRRLPTTVEELERLHGTQGPEFEAQIRQQAKYAELLKIPDPILKKWQDLTTTLDFSGKMIEKTFVVGLAKLADPLGHLSTAVTDVVAAFLDAAKKKNWIKDLGDALEGFAKIVGTDDFDKGVRGFVSGLGTLATSVGNAAKWISSFLPAPHGASIRDRAARAHGGRAHLFGHPLLDLGPLGTIDPTVQRNSAVGRLLGLDRGNAGGIMSQLQSRGFTREQAAAIVGNLSAESGLSPSAINASSGAFGLEQLLGSRKSGLFNFARQSGRSPYDIATQLDWLKMEQTGESVKYGGSDEREAYRKAFASKNMVEGFGRYVERPSEGDLTSSMAKRIGAAQDAYSTRNNIGITVQIPTGSNTIFSVNGMKGT